MARLLYRLGGFCFRRRWAVVGVWLVMLALAAILAGLFKGSTNDTFSVPGTESERALALLDARFPGTGGATARIVFAAPAGHTLTEDQYKSVVGATTAAAEKVPQTVPDAAQTAESNLQLSKDKKIAFADLHFTVPVANITDTTKDALEKVADPARRAGLEVEYSGGVISTATPKDHADIVGVVLAYLVLAITFAAFLAAGIPLLMALMSVGIGLLNIQALTGIATINSSAPTLALMLGLAVGIDYSTFIVSRTRQHLHEKMEPEQAVARAVATAGSAVAFAGVTVVIALLGLSVVGIPFLQVMGFAAAGTVVVAVAIALTLLPALLSLLGTRVSRQRRALTEPTLGNRHARAVSGRPWLALTGVLVIVAIGAISLPGMRQGLPSDASKPTSTTERRAYDLLTKGFGPGANGWLLVVVDTRGSHTDAKTAGADGVKELDGAANVASALGPAVNKAGDVAIIQVTPHTGPTSAATVTLVNDIRAKAKQLNSQDHVAVYVTGQTAVNIDTSNRLSSALPIFVTLIVGLALLLLIVVFRSLLVPLTAAVGFILSVLAALGLTRFVFQSGHGLSLFGVDRPGPVVSFVPVLAVAIMFGLAMDYEVFLVSRMREAHADGEEARQATISGLTASARVVTAAAVIMISVFSAFLADESIVIKQIAFALAIGVAIDAFLIRMTLVPAVHRLLGERAWALPKWLDRILPDLDIEGASLPAVRWRQPAQVATPDVSLAGV